MRTEVVGDVSEKPRCLVARRLDDLTLERRQGARHPIAPGLVITCVCGLLQQDIVAYRLNGDEAKTAGTRFLRRHCDILGCHALSQALGLLTRVSHHSLFNTAIDALLRSKGGTHKPIESRHLSQAADQANPTCADFDKHHMESQDQSMEEGKTRNALKKLHHMGTGIKPILPCAPRLKRGSGNVQRLGCLTLG